MLPRLQGNAIQAEGGWSWQYFITFMGDGNEGLRVESTQFFTTKEDAIADMKKAMQEACNVIQEKLMGRVTGEYIDMKTNDLRRWDGSDQN